jgi:hypothetical protein
VLFVALTSPSLHSHFANELWWKVVHRPAEDGDDCEDEDDGHDHSHHHHHHSHARQRPSGGSRLTGSGAALEAKAAARSEADLDAAFAAELKAMITGSFALLKEWVELYLKQQSSAAPATAASTTTSSAAASTKVDEKDLEKVLSLEFFARIVGAFEMNNLSTVNACPSAGAVCLAHLSVCMCMCMCVEP